MRANRIRLRVVKKVLRGSSFNVNRESLQVAGCRLQVAGCRLQVAGCRLQVAGCRLQGRIFTSQDAFYSRNFGADLATTNF